MQQAQAKSEKSNSRSDNRLVEVDALRGVAALSVVLFHFTTRFQELFQFAPKPAFSVPLGHYGVNLFFIISGFVIFMTLQRTTRPLDFVVSRFSRLFPAFWIAIAITYSVTHWLGLPIKTVDATTALANVLMIHGILGFAHVDGVYWTLEVELLFYILMFGLFHLKALGRVQLFLALLIGIRLIYIIAEFGFGASLSWTLSRLLILQYIPWFALGVTVYLLIHPRDGYDRRKSIALAVLAIGALLAGASLFVAVLAVCLAALVYGAARGKLPILRHPVMVWFGGISYPLYLVHENIGWSIQLEILKHGGTINLAFVAALVSTVALAALVSRSVERPAMNWLRVRYSAYKAK